MAEQELNRSEQATPYKLEEARKRGQVAKSADMISVVVFATAVAFLYARGWDGLRAQFQFDRLLLAQAGQISASDHVLWRFVEHCLRETLTLVLPVFLAIMLAAVVGNLIQIGPIFSVKPLAPDWERINPVNGLKRLFSMRTLFDGGRAIIKLALLGGVVWYALSALVPQFYHLAGLAPSVYLHTVLNDVASVAMKLAAMLLLIALADWAYTQREYANKMRMSRRELTDEIKHREGDPRVRARMKELSRELLKRSLAVRKTRNASVVITNPTHVAVALRYEHGAMEAPLLVAKGSGAMAAVMRRIASRHDIPVVQNPTLARRLYQELDIESSVPPHLYSAVARLMVWVIAMREARASRFGSATA
jgi:flagellar biosynthetic protein FlhB